MKKENIAFAIVTSILVILLLITLNDYIKIDFELERLKHENKYLWDHIEEEPIFIWNDDYESIPEEGTLIKIEKHYDDRILIGPHYPYLD